MVLVLVVLSPALLLSVDRVGIAHEEGQDQHGEENEFVVENEHLVEVIVAGGVG